MKPRLTLDEVRVLPHGDLIDRIEEILADYDAPSGIETQKEKVDRISRTLDEAPTFYRWFLMLESWCDHWAAANSSMFTQASQEYKSMRQRRDLFKNSASATKMRYEAVSRLVTVEQGFGPDGMPRYRKDG